MGESRTSMPRRTLTILEGLIETGLYFHGFGDRITENKE